MAIVRVVHHPSAGEFTSVMPAHCGACTLGDDHGCIGAAYTCAVDRVERYSYEPCPHPEQFVETTKPLEERYPGYGEDFWRKTGNAGKVQNMLMQRAADSGKGQVAHIQGLGMVYSDGPKTQINKAAFSDTPYTDGAA